MKKKNVLAIVLAVFLIKGEYKKHIIGLNDETMYVVEDISGAEVDKYRYEINFLPKQILPITFKSKD